MKYVIEIRLKSGLWIRADHLQPITAVETDGSVQVHRTPEGKIRKKTPRYLRVEWADKNPKNASPRVWVFPLEEVEAWGVYEEAR